MSEFFSLFIYFFLTLVVTLVTLGLSGLFRSDSSTEAKFSPYESGIRTEAHLMQERFPLRHYLVALMFLIFDIEVIFLYPWAVVAKGVGPFAFYEMAFPVVALSVGFLYVWRKGGLQWE